MTEPRNRHYSTQVYQGAMASLSEAEKREFQQFLNQYAWQAEDAAIANEISQMYQFYKDSNISECNDPDELWRRHKQRRGY